jgi:hypothetical protein
MTRPTKAAIRRELQAALEEIRIVGDEIFYPGAWRFPHVEGSATTSIPLIARLGTPQQQRLRIAVDRVEGLVTHVTGDISQDETLDAAVERLYAVRLASEAARLTGAQGGRKAAVQMTPDARRTRAQRAATARWITRNK